MRGARRASGRINRNGWPMPFFVLSPIQIAGITLGLASIAYLLLALRAVGLFRERAEPKPGWRPAVSILKPVCGRSDTLYDCLRSFCDQDWPNYEVIFGVHTATDAAIPVVERLIREFPQVPIRLVVDESLAGNNRKAANLANIFKAARHDILLLSDADVCVGRDCVAAIVAPFADAETGAVASIYKGRPIDTAAARFGALYINDWFVPSVCVDVSLRGIDFVFGAMSAIRRDTLLAIGGFERLAGCLAEDFSMGRFVANAGKRVVLSPYACDTIVDDKSFAEMFRHEVRWQRSERACRPLDQFMSVVTWPLPLLAALLLLEPSVVGLGVLGTHLGLRTLLHDALRRNFRFATGHEPWMVPLRECVCFLAWFAGLFGNRVQWGTSSFSIAEYRALMHADLERAALAPVTGKGEAT